jgi:hypothetical protein
LIAETSKKRDKLNETLDSKGFSKEVERINFKNIQLTKKKTERDISVVLDYKDFLLRSEI